MNPVRIEDIQADVSRLIAFADVATAVLVEWLDDSRDLDALHTIGLDAADSGLRAMAALDALKQAQGVTMGKPDAA